MPDRKFFIDIHCHLFNVEHVPLRLSIRRITHNFNKGLIKRGLTAVGAGAIGGIALPILALGSNSLAKKFYRTFEAFILFFDQPAQDNIKNMVTSVDKLGNIADIDTRTRIFTPLILDFQICEPYKRLANQVSDLTTAIDKSKKFLDKRNTLVLPFLGMDLRRFHKDIDAIPTDALNTFFAKSGVNFKPAADRRNVSQLENGDFLGIKLYPCLGFDISPKDNAIYARNIVILNHLKQLDIPITTHCQTASFECGPKDVSNETLTNYANPEKWWKLIKSNPTLSNLRINFAHFGGEEGIAKVMMWNDQIPDPSEYYSQPSGLFSSSWTYWIIKLIKTYPNAYSDISAFDFDDKKAVASLAWLIALDLQGEYDEHGTYKLIDKLMWGSDTPMILTDHGTYKKLFDAFYNVLDFQNFDTKNYGLPPSDTLPSRDELFELLVSINPRKFLFGQ